MADFACTAFFKSGIHGWTETYYKTSSDHFTAIGEFDTLMIARMALSPSTVSIVSYRASLIGTRNSTVLDQPSSLAREGTFGSTGEDTHVNLVGDSILVTLIAGPPQKNRKFLRGMPDSAFSDDTAGPPSGWLTLFSTGPTSYVQRLITGGWKCRNKARPPANGFVYSLITEVRRGQATIRRAGLPFGLQRGRRPTAR